MERENIEVDMLVVVDETAGEKGLTDVVSGDSDIPLTWIQSVHGNEHERIS